MQPCCLVTGPAFIRRRCSGLQLHRKHRGAGDQRGHQHTSVFSPTHLGHADRGQSADVRVSPASQVISCRNATPRPEAFSPEDSPVWQNELSSHVHVTLCALI